MKISINNCENLLVVDGATIVGGGAPLSCGAVALRTGGALMARFDAEDVDPVPLRTCFKNYIAL